MQFTKTFALLALPFLVAATPLEVRNDPPTTCNSGQVQCCNQVGKGSSPEISKQLGLLGLLDLVAQVVADVEVGLECTPISVIGVGSAGCHQQTVCCTGNSFSGGLLTLGCSPITINL